MEAAIRAYPSPIGLEIDGEAGIKIMPFSAEQLCICPASFNNYNVSVNLGNIWNIYVSE
ncbi:MAG: hypothetical protein WB930_11675 [Syntrophobacteraceae bacterium]